MPHRVLVNFRHYEIPDAETKAFQRELASIVMQRNPALHDREWHDRDAFLQALPLWALADMRLACAELIEAVDGICQHRMDRPAA